jgi:hypothetical protein
MVYAAFHRGPKKGVIDKIVSGAIKVFTRSQFSHVELYFSHTGKSFSASGMEGGVRFKDIKYTHHDRWQFVSLPWLEEYKVADYAKGFDGLKYDYTGIFLTFALPIHRQNDNQWWCSEICALLAGLFPYRISPGEMYNAVLAKGGQRVGVSEAMELA